MRNLRNMCRFSGWAQPVISRPWAVATVLLFSVSQLSGYRVLNGAKHTAWFRATGL